MPIPILLISTSFFFLTGISSILETRRIWRMNSLLNSLSFCQPQPFPDSFEFEGFIHQTGLNLQKDYPDHEMLGTYEQELATLEAHNFFCIPLIEVKSEVKL
jgi:hypothetical protein